MRWCCKSTITQRMVKMTGYTSATTVSQLSTIDEFIYLSLACLLPFRPTVATKMNSPRKMGKSCCEKKICLYNTTEAYLFHLKGEVWGHPPVLPQWHFPTWHSVTFPVKYCWYSCRGIKSMSKRDTSIKALSLPFYLLPSLPPLSISVYSSWTLFFSPSSSCSNTGLHALPTKCGWLASPGITRSLFNPKGLPKILSPRIYRTQTQTGGWQKAYDVILSKIQRLRCNNMPKSTYSRHKIAIKPQYVKFLH